LLLFLLDSHIFSTRDSICYFDRNRIYTYRDYLFRLSLDGLALLEESRWPADDKSIYSCHQKGQQEDDCRNYIRVLHVRGIHLPSGLFLFLSFDESP